MEKKGNFKRYDQKLFEELYVNLKAQQDMLSDFACKDKQAVRRRQEKFHVARPNFAKDADRILNCRYYNRYADKTQVFSLYKNDDISRRVLHVQIVSRIARSIGRLLKLNQDLIEAIALGHDLGHTPFGHAGERFLSAIYHERTGKYFNHNVHSVRILDTILHLNLSVQTLDGILCHNGEQVNGEYRPRKMDFHKPEACFAALDTLVAASYIEKSAVEKFVPCTLEGCVVRISDIMAYLGKDRQDAVILGIEIEEPFRENHLLGASNAEFISNLIEDIVSNSYLQDYLKLDEEYERALAYEKSVNYKKIYEPADKNQPYPIIREMFEALYDKMYNDLRANKEDSPIVRHHINKIYAGYRQEKQYREEYAAGEPNQIVVDYLASMTDDYFLDLYDYLFPGQTKIEYNSYFPKV